jgi:hypothetical protein
MRPSTRVAAVAGTVALVTAGAAACGSHPDAGRACQCSSARPSTMASTESRWYLRKKSNWSRS